MTDVSAGFRPPCWCPCTWAPAWRLHTNLYKFGENVSSHIFHEKNCCDLNLGESLCICTFFLFPDSGLNLLNGFDFLFWSILNGVTLKTSNFSEGEETYFSGYKTRILLSRPLLELFLGNYTGRPSHALRTYVGSRANQFIFFVLLTCFTCNNNKKKTSNANKLQ